jgi:hypothetical protein
VKIFKTLFNDAVENLAPGLVNNAEVIKNRIIYSSNNARRPTEKSSRDFMEFGDDLFDMPVERSKKAARKIRSVPDEAKRAQSALRENTLEAPEFSTGDIDGLGGVGDIGTVGDIEGLGGIGDIGAVGNIEDVGKDLSFNIDDMD